MVWGLIKMNSITQNEFESFNEVKNSGLTNMFNLREVQVLSGLDKETIKTIMNNYKSLLEKFN